MGVTRYIQRCSTCIENKPIAHVTFYMVMATPHRANYIVDYLQGKELDMPKWKKRVVAQEAMEFELIGNQLYKRGRDQDLSVVLLKKVYGYT